MHPEPASGHRSLPGHFQATGLVAALLATSTAGAQVAPGAARPPRKLVDCQVEAGFMKPVNSRRAVGVSGALNFLYRPGFGIGAGIRYANIRALAVPSDFDPGSGSMVSFGPTSKEDRVPRDYLSSYSLKAICWLQASPYTRLSLAVGPSHISISKAVFTPQPVQSSWGFFSSYSSNYEVDRETVHALGIDASARAEFMPAKGLAIGVGVWYQSSTQTELSGYELSLIISLVNEARHFNFR